MVKGWACRGWACVCDSAGILKDQVQYSVCEWCVFKRGN